MCGTSKAKERERVNRGGVLEARHAAAGDGAPAAQGKSKNAGLPFSRAPGREAACLAYLKLTSLCALRMYRG
jgi:hypothetical protein